MNSLRGNTDETNYDADAAKARSLARAARNAELDSVHEVPAPPFLSKPDRAMIAKDCGVSFGPVDVEPYAESQRDNEDFEPRAVFGYRYKAPSVPVDIDYNNNGRKPLAEQVARYDAVMADERRREESDLSRLRDAERASRTSREAARRFAAFREDWDRRHEAENHPSRAWLPALAERWPDEYDADPCIQAIMDALSSRAPMPKV
jgi:hypothetical protein